MWQSNTPNMGCFTSNMVFRAWQCALLPITKKNGRILPNSSGTHSIFRNSAWLTRKGPWTYEIGGGVQSDADVSPKWLSEGCCIYANIWDDNDSSHSQVSHGACRSQFFITLKSCEHLNNKHSVPGARERQVFQVGLPHLHGCHRLYTSWGLSRNLDNWQLAGHTQP